MAQAVSEACRAALLGAKRYATQIVAGGISPYNGAHRIAVLQKIRYPQTRRTGKICMTALSLLSCLMVAGCGNQQPLSRDDAASRAATSYSSMHVYQTNAKLMTWDAWTRIGLNHPGEAAGVVDLNIPPGRLVWVVALRDASGATGAVVMVDAVSGNQVMVSGGRLA